MPFQFGPADLYPIAGAIFIGAVTSGECPTTVVEAAGADGSFSMTLAEVIPEAGYTLSVLFGKVGRFLLEEGLPEYVRFRLDLPAGARPDLVFNRELGEFGSFHLMTYHHLRRAALEVEDLLSKHHIEYGVPEVFSWGARLRLENDTYGHGYLPYSRRMVISSDEVVPRDGAGRWRKVVPTILYHEYGHEFFRSMTWGYGESQVNEGLSDAFSAYVARVSTVGFVDEVTATADPAARDLKRDRTAWPHSPRQTVAGAFWELWDKTLDPPDPAKPLEQAKSSFAFGLLTRWLASKRWMDGIFLGGRAVEFTPFLGVELYLEADHPSLGGNNDLRDGFEHDSALIRAFGRRNLFQYPFVRGDSNGDSRVDISDALTTLGYLFLDGRDTDCPDALDSDDSGRIDITDAVFLLLHLFSGGGALPEPSGKCGFDPTREDGFSCWASPCRLVSPRWRW